MSMTTIIMPVAVSVSISMRLLIVLFICLFVDLLHGAWPLVGEPGRMIFGHFLIRKRGILHNTGAAVTTHVRA
jgi:hypothetical protein